MEKLELKVRKSNVLVDGRYRFNLNEQKILLLVISRIKPMDTEFVPYQVPWQEIKEATRGKINSAQKIHDVCEGLKSKTIYVQEGRKEIAFGFLSGWTVEPGRYVEFRIDPGMKTMLLDLVKDGNFTLYHLECVLSLQSTYAVRIYEILKSYQYRRKVVIPLDDLKRSLDIAKNNKTYSDFGNFRRIVLEKAQKDLKAHTDIQFTYNPMKDGRRVGSIEFTIKENKKYQRTIQGSAGATEVKKQLKDGDRIIIAGKEHTIQAGCVLMNNGAIPMGILRQMLETGEAKKI